MSYRSPARWLAPLALAATLFATFQVVQGGGSDSGPTATASSSERAPARERQPRRSTYTVRSGDALSLIAERTGVSVERLMELNEGLDAGSLTPGQKLRLRPRGQ
jgi:LysM repeat protein